MLIIAIINFALLIFSLFSLGYFYTLSSQPMKKIIKYGENTWKKCTVFRNIAGIFEFISVINLILWIWFPLPFVDEWKVSSDYWIGIIFGICILIPSSILLGKGVKDAGSETMSPSKDTEIYGGIYKYVRHPQTIGEFLIYISIGFMLNSWFLILILLTFILIYTPIMFYFEEKDLVRKYGEKYLEYKKRTGAIFPKIKTKKSSFNN